MTDASLNEREIIDAALARESLSTRVYDALMAAGKRVLADEFAAANGGDEEHTVPKTKILILAWDGDSSGFDWEPASDPTGVRLLHNRYRRFVSRPEYLGTTENFILTEVSVAGYAPDEAGRQRISDLIEGEWQDALTLGLVGHIVARYRPPCDNCGAVPGTPEFDNHHDSQNCWRNAL